MRNEKRPWLFRVYQGIILSSYVGIVISIFIRIPKENSHDFPWKVSGQVFFCGSQGFFLVDPSCYSSSHNPRHGKWPILENGAPPSSVLALFSTEPIGVVHSLELFFCWCDVCLCRFCVCLLGMIFDGFDRSHVIFKSP